MRHHRFVKISMLILILTLPGCLRHRSVVIAPKGLSGKRVYHSESPANLSEYIRTTLKISQENTVAEDNALKQLLERRPELAVLSRHIAEHSDDLNSRRLLAAVYMKEGLYANAFQLYQEIRAAALDDPTVELSIGRIWYEWREYALALQYAERALVLDPDYMEGLDLVGRIHLRRSEFDAALSAFLTALRVEPENPIILANVGYTFYLRGDWQQAREYLERALERDESLAEAQNNLGILLGQAGDSDGSLRRFQAAGESAAAFNNLGVIYLSQKRYREASGAFNQALVINPDYAKARANLAVAESNLPPPTVINLPSFGSRQSSVAVESKAEVARAESIPNSPETDTGVGQSGPSTSARPSAASMNSNRILIAYRDSLNRFRSKHYREAIEILEWLLKEYPDHRLAPNMHYWIGENFFGLGDYQQALVALRRVLDYKGTAKRHDAQLMIKRALSELRRERKS